jgi:hypothetical protein
MLLSRVAEYLALLPFPKRLSIHNVTFEKAPVHGWDDCVLLTLPTPSLDSGKCLCTRLEEFQFMDCIDLTEDALSSFVTARTSHPEIARLKQARFSFLRLKTRDVLPELEILHGQSLKITYTE